MSFIWGPKDTHYFKQLITGRKKKKEKKTKILACKLFLLFSFSLTFGNFDSLNVYNISRLLIMLMFW